MKFHYTILLIKSKCISLILLNSTINLLFEKLNSMILFNILRNICFEGKEWFTANLKVFQYFI